MSFNSDKQKSEQTKKTQAPPNVYTDMGNLKYNKKANSYQYISNESDANKQARTTTENSLNSLISGIPTSFTMDEMYNNPYYDTFKNYYTQPLQSQQAEDQRTLKAKLSAQNQLGSSYDAYQNFLQNKQYTSAYQQAENQARLGSADAYQQVLNNRLNTLSGLRNDYGQQLNAYWQPYQLAMGAQSTFAPYAQTTVTGSQSSDPSFMTRALQVAAAAAAFVPGGGSKGSPA